MKPELMCSDVVERLTVRGELPPESAAHVAECPSCWQIRETVAGLRCEDSAYPRDILAGMKLRLKERWQKESAPPVSWWHRLFAGPQPVFALVAMLFLILSGVWYMAPNGSRESTRFELAKGASPAVECLFDQFLHLGAGEKAQARLPDGSLLDLQGPLDARVLVRGFRIETGTIRATVQPGEKPFIGKTLHGDIRVLGTIFTCHSEKEKTEVTVEQGKVEITPRQGPVRVLVAGESGCMIYSGNAGTTGEVRQSPAPDSDPAQ